MLLDEDPATLIHHTINNFNTVPDKLAISRIQSNVSSLEHEREKRLRDADAALKKLSRQLNTRQTQYEELAGAHSSAAHASEMARLDTQKFRVAKAASDLEVETGRLAARAADLTTQLQELEMQGVEGGPADAAGRRRDPVDDEVLLRLSVYRSLGIDVERADPGRDGAAGAGSGEFCKAVVRNDRKGDVHVVNIDKKFSRFFYANYFWQTI
ncbi:putative kinetochore protein spc24 [Rosellinia necatrix]|uniref:Kinetochore protein Spc24 n=1 Tax=Rosellinia necatrix TaxID=77044 RepID=A0A1W2TFM2_ROSNE|nr:putative kinetochore protein spc24 [Rosellinia necatrix]